MNTTNKIKDVFVINEVKEGKSNWARIGVAFVNKDQSLNVVLDAIPMTGKIHIRDRKVAEKKEVA